MWSHDFTLDPLRNEKAEDPISPMWKPLRQMKCKVNVSIEKYAFSATCLFYIPHIYTFLTRESNGQREGTSQPLLCTMVNIKCHENIVTNVAALG